MVVGILPWHYVIVSAGDVRFPESESALRDLAGDGPETVIFAAYEDGDVATMEVDLPGGFRGAMDHAQALRNAGYEIAP